MADRKERSKLGQAITGCLACDEPELRAAALSVLRKAYESNGKSIRQTAVALDISERLFRRWLEDDAVRDAVGIPRMWKPAQRERA